MNNYIKFLILFGALTLFAACSDSGKKNKQQVQSNEIVVDPRVDQTMQRTKTDTMAIYHNVNEYLELLKNNQIEEALSKLYEASGDTVVPISNENRIKVLQTLDAFPVLDYHIDDLLMYSETDTEVRYTIQFYEKAPDDPRPNTLQCVINPRRVGYYWYLTISPYTIETNYRDEPKADISSNETTLEE